MKSRIILGITIFLIFGATAKKGSTTTIWWSGLPDLAIESDIIASGTITFKDGKTILVTDRILKGQAPKRLTLIVNTNQYMEGAVSLAENENVLLFLKSIGSGSAQLTAGDLAKWPRAEWLRKNPDLMNNASPESIADLVNQILRIESKTDINDRVDILRNWFDSPDSLLNLIALQYALTGHIWSNEPSPDYQTSIDRNNILKNLSGYAFRLIQKDSPLVQIESIRLLGYADPERALPILIGKITDPNRNIRAATCSELMTFSHGKNIDDNLKYRSDESPEELLSIQRRWREWYDANYGKQR